MDNFRWIQEGYHVLLQLNGQSIRMELDTGDAISVISEVEWNKLFHMRNYSSTKVAYLGDIQGTS